MAAGFSSPTPPLLPINIGDPDRSNASGSYFPRPHCSKDTYTLLRNLGYPLVFYGLDFD
jgi:hypothetical protein